ncbi:MAG TPA: hypothetical protein VI138_09375 [Candidatus Dormibacteraeota bacterium]
MKNPFSKRLTIVLASVGAIGAIAAIATAASLALFYDPTAPVPVAFATGDVTLNNAVVANCTTQNITPGFSTRGYPASLGDQSGNGCTVDIDYTGSLDAFLALDVSVTTTKGTSTIACNGGDSSGTASCEPLYNPSARGSGMGDGLEVYVLANGDSYSGGGGAENGPTQAFGIGNDQTISNPGTNGVDVNYGQTATGGTAAKCNSSTGEDCPVKGGDTFRESYSVYVYWPIDSMSQQNIYQNASATVTLREHAVQAADNPLLACSGINDSQGLFGGASYSNPDQPQVGWGSGFTAGGYPAVGGCPTPDTTTNGTDWTASTPGTTLVPFYHPDN